MNRTLKIAALIVVVICLCETAGILFSILFRGISYEESRHEKTDLLVSLNRELDRNQKPGQRSYINDIPRKIHPYFGFTLKPGYRGTNNHGFPSSYNYPYRSHANTFVVGIIGGSVSMQLANDNSSRTILEDGLLNMLSRNGFESVRLLSIGSGGWRQPQTFYAFAYYLDMVDMVLFLDGYNEISRLEEGKVAEWPARYPWRSLYVMLSTSDLPVESLTIVGEIAFLERKLKSMTNSLSRFPWNRSLFLHSLWRIASNRRLKRIALLREENDTMLSREISPHTSLNESAVNKDVHIEDYFDFYYRLSLWQHLISKEQGVPYFHFVQPNQYVRNSKAFSDEEREKYLTLGKNQTAKVSKYYEKLDTIIVKLSSDGVNSFQLSGIFKEVADTVYRDNCCHLNERGNIIMAEKILEAIKASGSINEEGEFTFSGNPVRKHR
jgi:hypothetical protein